MVLDLIQAGWWLNRTPTALVNVLSESQGCIGGGGLFRSVWELHQNLQPTLLKSLTVYFQTTLSITATWSKHGRKAV